MISAITARLSVTFAPMSVHVGKVLREVYLATGLKMENFCSGVAFSSKTVYYHFGQEDLNTSILGKYEAGLKKLGFDVDLFEVLSRKRRGDYVELLRKGGSMTVNDPPIAYQRLSRQDRAAELLQQAAELLRTPKQAAQPSISGGASEE